MPTRRLAAHDAHHSTPWSAELRHGFVMDRLRGARGGMRGGARFANRRLSVWSTRKVTEIDRRTLEGKREQEVIDDLTRHVGTPTVTERILIARAARLTVTVELMERRMVEDGEVGDLNGRQLLAWIDVLWRVLVALGVEKRGRSSRGLADVPG